MIQESVREITTEEREGMPVSAPVRLNPRMSPGYREEGWMLVIAAILLAGFVLVRGIPTGSVAAGLTSATMVPVILFVIAFTRDARFRRRCRTAPVPAPAPPPRVLDDGRVLVKRVHASAVVEIEEVEDEGPGYLYDVGGGQVLFLKGLDYDPLDDETPWPNTDFEIVRGLVDGEFVGMTYHGKSLPPSRVIRRGEFDPGALWDDREEVLPMSLDDAVKRILRSA